jgi:hypothetical protein
MKVNSSAAIDLLAGTFSHVPRQLLELAPTFTIGQGLIAGRIAPLPTLFSKRSPSLAGGWSGRADDVGDRRGAGVPPGLTSVAPSRRREAVRFRSEVGAPGCVRVSRRRFLGPRARSRHRRES